VNLQQAQARTLELRAKLHNGETLNADEQTELATANGIIAGAAEQMSQTRPTMEQAKKYLEGKGVLSSSSIFSNPTVVLAGKVIGVLAIAGLSAFGGMKYEQRRQSRGRSSSRSTDMLSIEHSNSPQSHPATSSDDGRLAANRADNVVAHPTASRRAAASA
jgi:hypothetical protein